MVDIEIIKENYRRMSDEQLIRFAKLETENLRLESFHALKDELISRNIDLKIIEELDDVDKPLNPNSTVTKLYINSLFVFAIDKKSIGVSNHEIYNGLLEKKIGADQAFMIIQMLKEVAEKSLNNIETEILVTWVLFILGLLLSLFTYSQIDIKFFIGLLIIITASIKLANSYASKKKFVQTIENCKNDETSVITDLYQ